MEALGSGSTQHRTVLSAGFSIFLHWKVAVNRVHNSRPCTGFLFSVYSWSYYGLQYMLYLFLPTNGPPTSGGLFCAPEYCSVFAVIQMYCTQRIRSAYCKLRIFHDLIYV